MEVLGRWDSLVPLLREWVPAASDVIAEARLAPPLTYPGKVLCAGANYWDHCAEMGVEPPTSWVIRSSSSSRPRRP